MVQVFWASSSCVHEQWGRLQCCGHCRCCRHCRRCSCGRAAVPDLLQHSQGDRPACLINPSPGASRRGLLPLRSHGITSLALAAASFLSSLSPPFLFAPTFACTHLRQEALQLRCGSRGSTGVGTVLLAWSALPLRRGIGVGTVRRRPRQTQSDIPGCCVAVWVRAGRCLLAPCTNASTRGPQPPHLQLQLELCAQALRDALQCDVDDLRTRA